MFITVARALFAACMSFSLCAYSEVVVTAADGPWPDPSTWSGGIVPAESDDIIVNHSVALDAGSAIRVSSLRINGRLELQPGTTLQLVGVIPDAVVLTVSGILESAAGSVLDGTTGMNTVFEAGSRYIHRQGPLGFIPIAMWHKTSTVQISGFVDDGYINLAHSASWRQSFGNVEYDCPEQTVFIVDLNGHLRDIRGNFTVKSTNNKALRLSTTQSAGINIGGDLIIEGPSQVWFSTNSADCAISIAGNFAARSEATASCYLATRGKVRIAVGGDWIIDSDSPLRMASSAADSTGTRHAAVSVGGSFRLVKGGIIAPPPGSGRGVIEFNGTLPQHIDIAPISSLLTGNLEYVVAEGAAVVLGTSVLSSDQGSLDMRGRLELGSADPGGALQISGGGNIRVPGTRTFANGSTVVYNAATLQFIGNGHPSSCHTLIDNPEGVGLVSDMTVKGNLIVARGNVLQNDHILAVEGDVVLPGSQAGLDHVIMQGANSQSVDARNAAIAQIDVTKSAGSVTLTSPLRLVGTLHIATPGIAFHSNGHLTLVSTGDEAGQTATVDAIPTTSYIDGAVTTQRYMSAEGRMYRYLSSPVGGATVADLMDDFPVTGAFDDPSTGPGIRSSSPSLFEYDESTGQMMEGWRPYPAGGLAANAPLQAGRGYAAFIRNQLPAVVDLSGVLNQGEIHLPLSFTNHSGTGNGWHLIGNPYPAAIDWDAPAFAKERVSSVIAIRDNGDRRFRYWDGDDLFSGIPDGKVAQGQSFWVRALSPGASLTFREAVKTSDAAFYRRPVSAVPAFMISVSDGQYDDQVVLRLRRGSSETIDRWDGVKLSNDTLNISTVTHEGIRLAIDSRPSLPDTLGLRMSEFHPARYTIVLNAGDSLRQVSVYLVDRFLKQEVRLRLNDTLRFEVTADTASHRADRFTLRFKKAERYPFVPLDSGRTFHEGSAGTALPTYYPNPVREELIIEGDPTDHWPGFAGAAVMIYTASGMQVDPTLFSVRKDIACIGSGRQLTLNCARWVVQVDRLAAGSYLLRLDGQHIRWLRFVKI